MSKGEALAEFGTLKIDLGSLDPSDLHFYNDGIEWTPLTIEDGSIVYSLQSNGRFELRGSNRELLFWFTNSMEQDFTIAEGWHCRASDAELIDKWADGTYIQRDWSVTWGAETNAIKSTGTSIKSLDVTASSGTTVSKVSGPEGYGDDWIFIRWSKPDKQPGDIIQIFVGDVLVATYVITE